MNTFWDERYDTEQFVYGKEPNRYFASEIDSLTPASLLLPGEGEGRNAVYAASRGWRVVAFDQSKIGAEKALGFAKERGVEIEYQVCGMEDYTFLEEQFEVVGLIYFHALPTVRKLLHSHVIRALKPGGRVILEAFHVSQLGNGTGGPQSPEMLFDEKKVLDDFADLQCLNYEERQVILDEGGYHQVLANMVSYSGLKRKRQV